MKPIVPFILSLSLLTLSACQGKSERAGSQDTSKVQEQLVLIDTFWTHRGIYPPGIDEEATHLLSRQGIDRDSVRVIRRDYTRDHFHYRVRWDWFVTPDSTAFLGYTDYNLDQSCL